MPTPYIYKTLFFSLSPVDIGCVPGSIFNVKKNTSNLNLIFCMLHKDG